MTSIFKIVFGIMILFLLTSGLVSNEWEYECYIVQLPIQYNRVSINGIKYHNKVAWINHDSIADLITKKKGKWGYELVDVTPITGCLSGYKVGTSAPVTQQLLYHFKRRK